MTLLGPAGFDPDRARADARDAIWRGRLAGSLRYLAQVLGERGHPLESVSSALDAGPVSPWVSCLYSKLVADVSAKDSAGVDATLGAFVAAIECPAFETEPVVLGEPSIPELWWGQCLRLIDTDHALPFRPVAPSEEVDAGRRSEIAEAIALLGELDPPALDELRSLLRVIVFAAPATDRPTDDFGAVSSFFLRELVVLNAARRGGIILTLDTLIHEASHVLLFSLAIEQPLTSNDGSKRYRSAARSDPRPIDGIFHASFVATRVHAAMTRWLDGGRLTASQAREAEARRERNANVARDTLQTLVDHAETTPTGEAIRSALSSYWAAQAQERARAS